MADENPNYHGIRFYFGQYTTGDCKKIQEILLQGREFVHDSIGGVEVLERIQFKVDQDGCVYTMIINYHSDDNDEYREQCSGIRNIFTKHVNHLQPYFLTNWRMF